MGIEKRGVDQARSKEVLVEENGKDRLRPIKKLA
jgi:hypothetical protein